jgi:hypothetical protein
LAAVHSTLAIYPDEVGHVDFHHALLGVPSSKSTFFHRPSASSSAALLYTLSENSLLGAVNPKDGSLLWRQNLTRPSQLPDHNAEGLLRASDGTNAVVSALGDHVSAWSALDGKLLWENWSPGMPIVDIELLELEDASVAPSTRDAIALSGGQAGSVKRLDGQTGEIKWERHDERFANLLPITLGVRELTYVAATFPSRCHPPRPTSFTSPYNRRY